jgi:hypothetical protein
VYYLKGDEMRAAEINSSKIYARRRLAVLVTLFFSTCNSFFANLSINVDVDSKYSTKIQNVQELFALEKSFVRK